MRSLRILRSLLLAATWSFLAQGASAQEAVPSPAPSPTPQASAMTETEEAKLQVHGYLSQAYGFTDHDQLLGVPDNGTADYRTAAIQFRYALTSNDGLLFQFSHRRLGQSLVMSLEPEVRADWIFYEHRFGSGGRARAGRIPIPQGIYNEIRDVGVLLPFYRAPFNFYQEGSFTSETVDGVSLGYTVGQGKPWELEASGYYGEWTTIEENTEPRVVATARAKNGLGGQLWLRTPVSGLRVGLGGQRMDIRGGVFRPAGVEDDWKSWNMSLDADLPKFTLQAEFKRTTSDGLGLSFEFQTWYVYAGVPFGKLRLNAQADLARITAQGVDSDRHKDYALGLGYAFRPGLVAKAETHWTRTQVLDNRPVQFGGPGAKVNYTLLSLSVSF